MAEQAIPAVFMRGGTSKAIIFHARDLPADRAAWDAIFTAAMGSPDPYGRQLNGMGGGVSSLSKICVLAPSTRDDADIDYTFGQVLVRENRVDYKGNCGNMSSAVGPFAVDQGLVRVQGDTALVRIYNTNTRKIIHATFPLIDGQTRYDGDLAIPGVAGTGAPIRLDFVQPGGASTGKLLPTGNVIDRLDVPGLAASKPPWSTPPTPPPSSAPAISD
jgi:2-methylaconitate cis-trans-isomerase PrpF